MTRFSVSPGIRSLPVYPVPGEEQILRKYKLDRLIKLASNENCYGASPLAVHAVRSAAYSLHRYPEVYGAPLKAKLAQSLQLQPLQIILGNGSTELVEIITRTFLQPGEKSVTALETFPIYEMAVTAMNGISQGVPLRDHRYDLEAMLQAIDRNTRIVFIANPNNPTGTALPRQDLVSFLERVPANVIVVLDEAYREYAGLPGDPVLDIARHPNLIVLRTFSKIYGLAGLRIGYAVCSEEVSDSLNRATMPYSVNLLAQLAAAAALEDQTHVTECAAKNAEQREKLQQEFSSRSYVYVPTSANFILLKSTDPAALCESLLQKGILVAAVPHFHVPDGVRITLGTPEENELLLDALISE